jgi:hypothetical protein
MLRNEYSRMETTGIIPAQVNPFESRSAMGAGRLLMVISETLAVVAVLTQFFLPTGMGVSLYFAHRAIGLPVRWVVPLLLISVAGALSLASLFDMYWRLAHVPLGTGQ